MTKTQLGDAIKQLNDATANTLSVVEKLDPNDINTMLKAFRQLGDHIDHLNTLHKLLNHSYDTLSSETIPNALESMGLDSVKTGGYTFTPSVRLFASIPEAKKEAGFAWLEEHGLSALIKPSVNSQSLSSAVKSYIESTAEEPPAEALSICMKKYTQVRKA